MSTYYSSVPAWNRVVALTEKTKDGCWCWLGAVTSQGYPYFIYRGHQVLVRRFIYCFENNLNSIAKGHDVMAICEWSLCVCPDHIVLQKRMRSGSHRAIVDAKQTLIQDQRIPVSVGLFDKALHNVSIMMRRRFVSREEATQLISKAVNQVRERLGIPPKELNEWEIETLIKQTEEMVRYPEFDGWKRRK